MKATTSEYHSGRVKCGLPFSLASRDTVTIGSNRGCDIVIDGADPHHAEVIWDADATAWRVRDDPAPGVTSVNGKPIENVLIREGDWFDVAGVRIVYSDDLLKELDPSQPVGLRVTLRGVSATVDGIRRLDNVSFQAREGAFVALLGPSGCGKSMLIQRIAGLAPFEGDIRLNGHDIRAEKARLLPLVAYLPQAVEDTLHADMTVGDAMRDFARCHLPAGMTVDFDERLKEVGLGERNEECDFTEKRIRDLSGGQKRRFALALALLRQPQLLLLDEPTAGLDPAAEAGIMELLRQLADQKRTILCATHVLGSLDLCDEVDVLAPGGRLVFQGAPAEALRHFDASDWLAVYQKLEDGNCAQYRSAEADDSMPRRLPALPSPASFGGVFGATSSRLIGTALARRNAALFFGNPLGISAVLLLACSSIFEKGNLGTIYFCMSVGMFWLGLSGSIRNLVAERVPKRCLDRMRGMPLSRYFSAHVVFTAASSFVQSFLFILPVFLLKLAYKPFSLGAFLPFWLILFLAGFAGSCVGLFVSALSKKELQAVWALPFIAVLALFLGKPVLEGGGSEKPTGLLRVIERIMPTYHTQEVLETEMAVKRGETSFDDEDNDQLPAKNASNWRWFVILAVSYPALFLSLAYVFQNWRERQWNGR